MAKKIFVKHVLIFSDKEEEMNAAADEAVDSARMFNNVIAYSEVLSKKEQDRCLYVFAEGVTEFFDETEKEYDFSGGERGKHAENYSEEGNTMPVSLTGVERKVLVQFLDELSVRCFSNKGCNDFHLPNTTANKAFARAAYKHCMSEKDAKEWTDGFDGEMGKTFCVMNGILVEYLRAKIARKA